MSVQNIMSANLANASQIDSLQDATMKLTDTSKKIRYLLSQGKTIAQIYKLLKQYGVTTKEGNEIRYQHVRNVAMTKLSK